MDAGGEEARFDKRSLEIWSRAEFDRSERRDRDEGEFGGWVIGRGKLMLQNSKMRGRERRHEEMSISGDGGAKGDIVQGGDRKFYGSRAI